MRHLTSNQAYAGSNPATRIKQQNDKTVVLNETPALYTRCRDDTLTTFVPET